MRARGGRLGLDVIAILCAVAAPAGAQPPGRGRGGRPSPSATVIHSLYEASRERSSPNSRVAARLLARDTAIGVEMFTKEDMNAQFVSTVFVVDPYVGVGTLLLTGGLPASIESGFDSALADSRDHRRVHHPLQRRVAHRAARPSDAFGCSSRGASGVAMIMPRTRSRWRQDRRSSRKPYPDIPRWCPGNRVRYNESTGKCLK